MQYGTTQAKFVEGSDIYLSFDDAQVGNVYKPTSMSGIYFPTDYAVNIKGTDYYNTTSNSANLYFGGSIYFILGTTSITLASGNALRVNGDVLIVDDKSTAVNPKEGVYTLTATKTYTIYSNKTLAPILNEQGKNIIRLNTTDENNYKYVYAFTISHTNNFVGRVPKDDLTRVYISEGEEQGNVGASLNVKDDTIYYGDKPDHTLVTITTGYGEILRVDKDETTGKDKVYLTDSDGNRMKENDLVLDETYYLTA